MSKRKAKEKNIFKCGERLTQTANSTRLFVIFLALSFYSSAFIATEIIICDYCVKKHAVRNEFDHSFFARDDSIIKGSENGSQCQTIKKFLKLKRIPN
jgi:hypothetical protein